MALERQQQIDFSALNGEIDLLLAQEEGNMDLSALIALFEQNGLVRFAEELKQIQVDRADEVQRDSSPYFFLEATHQMLTLPQYLKECRRWLSGCENILQISEEDLRLTLNYEVNLRYGCSRLFKDLDHRTEGMLAQILAEHFTDDESVRFFDFVDGVPEGFYDAVGDRNVKTIVIRNLIPVDARSQDGEVGAAIWALRSAVGHTDDRRALMTVMPDLPPGDLVWGYHSGLKNFQEDVTFDSIQRSFEWIDRKRAPRKGAHDADSVQATAGKSRGRFAGWLKRVLGVGN